VERAPLSASSWTGSLIVLLTAATVYFSLRVVARVGAIAVVFADARKKRSEGLVLEGCYGFLEGALGMTALFVLDVLGIGGVVLAMHLSAGLSVAHGALGALAGAGMVSLLSWGWLLAASFGTVAFVLSIVDGDGISFAWSRVWRLVGSADAVVRGRFMSLLLVLGALSMAIGFVDFVSGLVSTVGDVSSRGNSFLVMVPVLTLVYSLLVDVAALVFLAALTDRLPLGFATPILLTRDRPDLAREQGV
jgi:hypothetical protein